MMIESHNIWFHEVTYRNVACMKRSRIRDNSIKNNKTVAGFTLLELLLCLCLAGIITFFSLAYTPSLYKKNQLEAVTADIKSAIHTAKLQALVTGKTLALTHLPDAKDWSEGMLLFEDNPKHQYTPNINPLYEWRWKSKGMLISWHGFQSKDYLLFATDLNSSVTNGTFDIQGNGQQVTLVVNRVGRVRKYEQ